MNPIAYCAIASCSNKDWEVFGAIILAIFSLVTIGGIIEWFTSKHEKDKDMK